MANHIGQCETCGEQAARLNQSYVSGGWECDGCALDDPFMSAEQAAAIRRRLARGAQARANFRGEAATATATAGALF